MSLLTDVEKLELFGQHINHPGRFADAVEAAVLAKLRSQAAPAGPPAHFVSACCAGELCARCTSPATHKVGEEVLPDEPNPHRHNLTAYLCCTHFRELFGPAAPCAAGQR